MGTLKQIRMADVSTCHVTQRDTELLTNEDPSNPAIADQYEYGFYLHVPCIFQAEESFEDRMTQFADYGYSDPFLDLMRQANAEDFSLIRLDCDGTSYNDLPSFDW